MEEIEEIKDRLEEWANGKQEGNQRDAFMVAYEFDGEKMELTGIMNASASAMTAAICLQAEDHPKLYNIVIEAGRRMLEKKLDKTIEKIIRDIKNEDK